MSKGHFIFDKNKCVGCEACVIACINENGFQETGTWRNVHSSNPEKLPGIPLFNLSMSCNHCEKAVCMEYCPALAYSLSPITGAVLHSPDKCIGCQYCTWNCPYDAPKYNPITGVIAKCNLCESRLQENQKPACATLCPTGALDFKFSEMDQPTLESNFEVPIQTQPSISIKEPLKKSAPKIDKNLFKPINIKQTKNPEKSKISASKEWTLVLFTWTVSYMVAITALDIMESKPLGIKLIFLIVGAAGAGLSMLHLGKPLRAHRALLNIRKSWLSREILFFSLFYIATFFDLLVSDLPNWLILLFGIFLILSIDMLYQPVQLHWKTKLHSAQAIFITVSYYLLFSNLFWILGLLMIFRVYLFVSVNPLFNFKGQLSASLKIIRILSIMLTFISILLNYPYWIGILIFTIGEILDRIAFYNDLELPDIKKVIASNITK